MKWTFKIGWVTLLGVGLRYFNFRVPSGRYKSLSLWLPFFLISIGTAPVYEPRFQFVNEFRRVK